MASGSWGYGYYVMNAVDQKKWRAPKLGFDVISQAELHGVYAAEAVGIEGDSLTIRSLSRGHARRCPSAISINAGLRPPHG